MRRLLALYITSVVYAYTLTPPLPHLGGTEPEKNFSPVFEGQVLRRPSSFDFREKSIRLSPISFLLRSDLEMNSDRAENRRLMSREALLHIDGYGLIVQANGDGGDTAQRTGMLFFRYEDEIAFRHALSLLEVSPGIYVRHPFQGGFRNDPNEFSRDQQRPLVIALGHYGMRSELWSIAKLHLFRFGKYQNQDYLGPVNIGEYVRAFDAWPLYPLLFLTDFGLLASSLGITMSGHWDSSDVDDNNHLMSLLQSQQVMSTPVSWLARKIYKKYRPQNEGNTVLGETNGAQGALSWYHRIESGGNPFIAEVYRDAIRDL